MVFTSCKLSSSDEESIPDERKLSEEDMQNIFYEMHLADAIVMLHMVKLEGDSTVMSYQVDSMIYDGIYEKYGCTRELFEESVLWYFQNDPEELKSIYEKVVDMFNRKIAEMGRIKNDSVAAVRNNTL